MIFELIYRVLCYIAVRISMSEITTAFKEALNVALEPVLASFQKNNTPAESKTEEAPADELHEATKQFLAAKQAQPLGGKTI